MQNTTSTAPSHAKRDAAETNYDFLDPLLRSSPGLQSFLHDLLQHGSFRPRAGPSRLGRAPLLPSLQRIRRFRFAVAKLAVAAIPTEEGSGELHVLRRVIPGGALLRKFPADHVTRLLSPIVQIIGRT